MQGLGEGCSGNLEEEGMVWARGSGFGITGQHPPNGAWASFEVFNFHILFGSNFKLSEGLKK